MRPPKELRSNLKTRKNTLKSPNELGIVPLRQLNCKLMSRANVNKPIEDGIAPAKLFRFRAKNLIKAFIRPRVVGSVPVKLFELRFSVIIFVRSPMLDGRLPTRQLLCNCTVFKANKCPKDTGILPANLRFIRFRRITLKLPSHTTPVHEFVGQTGTSGTLFVHVQPVVSCVFSDNAAAKSQRASV